ncbi:hypothetical protein [Piscirickettsia litoralis]|uniref:Uncharacterized protein n=1 Tax=Piscirickettsia litoralis TaxID=1891921 RepID=A0ABX2ZYD2_9GAMM|nr:hypothetical protein [Piscirickettsia litoralis]ODN41205.1 hypothetical protein BGC07_17480 [Piscirickettsia litoralis]
MPSTTHKILELLQSGEELTRPKAYELGFGHCLPTFICQLRKEGYSIRSWKGKKGYYHYQLDTGSKNQLDLFESRQLEFEW